MIQTKRSKPCVCSPNTSFPVDGPTRANPTSGNLGQRPCFACRSRNPQPKSAKGPLWTMKKIIPSRPGREWCRSRWWRALRLTMRGSHPAMKFRLTRRTTHADPSFFLLHLRRPRLPLNCSRARAEGALAGSAPVFAELTSIPAVNGQLIAKLLGEMSIAIDFDLCEDVWLLPAL